MVFSYPTPATPTPPILPLLWWLGGLMVCVGGYWFWFFIRVDVAAEGQSPFRVMRADLFILSLLASVTLGLVWAFLQARGSAASGAVFGLYILATTVLFGSVPWSKFAHMFFKPAAALEKRVSRANGRPRICRRRPGTIPHSVNGTPWSCCATPRWTWGSASSAKPRATTRNRKTARSFQRNGSRSQPMPTFVYMTRCDGCGHCVDICPSDIMHIDKTYRRAYNIEPNMCWECYSCVKACPQHAIDVRGYADFAPLGHSVRVDRDEQKGTIAWRIKFRNGTEKNFLSPITTKPWGQAIPKLAEVPAPSKEMRDSQLLYNEPKWIRMDDGGLHTLQAAGLKMKQGVYY